jgi:hypothetical protein
MFSEVRQLSQAILQNGGSVYEVIELYSTKSIRQMKKVFKDLRDKLDAQQQQAFQQKQQELEQQAQQFKATQDAALQQHMIEKEKLKVARENMQNDLAIAKENRKGRNKPSK